MSENKKSDTEREQVNKNESEKKQVVKLSAGRGSRNVRQSKDEREMSSLDRKLAKEEAAAKEANVIAAKDPELHGRTKLQAKAMEITLALLSALIGSVATVCIMLPNGLTFGGITGIARIIQDYTSWNYSLIYYVLAMIILAIVWIRLGFKEAKKIILMSIAYPGFMFLLEISHLEFRIEDKLMAAIFCGVVMGVSNGLTFKAGYSSGGTDSLAKVIKYKRLPHLGINDITFVINTLIVICSAVILGLDIALYAVLTIYCAMRIGEAVMFGLSTKIVEVDIIPSNPDALAKYIMEELGRGVSSMEVTGEYTGDKRKMMRILCSPRESFLIKRHLAKNDPKSFVSVKSVSSVWGVGRGFSDIRSME